MILSRCYRNTGSVTDTCLLLVIRCIFIWRQKHLFPCTLQALKSVEHSEQKITPDELVRLTRPLTLATAKAVAAGNSGHQDDIIAAANMGRKAVSDLLRGCRVSDVWFCMLVAVMSVIALQCDLILFDSVIIS